MTTSAAKQQVRGSSAALARAMLSFSEASDLPGSVGIDPGRVDYLLGEPPSRPFPVMLCGGYGRKVWARSGLRA